ncbi:MAG TPA: hypothetical protein VF494_13640, partial [Candidatus Limnocylindrales bacterium]
MSEGPAAVVAGSLGVFGGTMTEPKSTSTQCDAAVPSRPIGRVRSSRRLPMIPVAIASSWRSE